MSTMMELMIHRLTFNNKFVGVYGGKHKLFSRVIYYKYTYKPPSTWFLTPHIGKGISIILNVKHVTNGINHGACLAGNNCSLAILFHDSSTSRFHSRNSGHGICFRL